MTPVLSMDSMRLIWKWGEAAPSANAPAKSKAPPKRKEVSAEALNRVAANMKKHRRRRR